jgi:hypothetical protein
LTVHLARNGRGLENEEVLAFVGVPDEGLMNGTQRTTPSAFDDKSSKTYIFKGIPLQFGHIGCRIGRSRIVGGRRSCRIVGRTRQTRSLATGPVAQTVFAKVLNFAAMVFEREHHREVCVGFAAVSETPIVMVAVAFGDAIALNVDFDFYATGGIDRLWFDVEGLGLFPSISIRSYNMVFLIQHYVL